MIPSSRPGFAVVLRGYDRARVDTHLAHLQEELDAAQERAAVARSEVVEPPAQRSGQSVSLVASAFRRLEQEVSKLWQQAERDAQRIRNEALAQARLVQTRAEERVLSLVDEARAEAARICSEHADLRGERESVRRQATTEAHPLLRRAADHAQQRAEAVVAAAETEAQELFERARQHCRETEDEARAVQDRVCSANGALARLLAALEIALGPEEAGPAGRSHTGIAPPRAGDDAAPEGQVANVPGPNPTGSGATVPAAGVAEPPGRRRVSTGAAR
ncbi:MAG: DivIVA domain-containing protein [Actinomycetota bacterium]|nr:DivIVA domain-containing protein [Actinomycetota bacterium]